MTRTKHPLDKRERFLIEQKKKKQREEERSSRIRRKLAREEAKSKETQDELERIKNDRDVNLVQQRSLRISDRTVPQGIEDRQR